MWFADFFQLGVYKRSQGRITRQVTFAALLVLFILGAWRLYTFTWAWAGYGGAYGLVLGILAIGGWISYRLVNMARFADFLIAVEAEMYKVSWPSRQELIRSSLVVIFVIFAMGFVLYAFDFLWSLLFQWLGVNKSA